MSDCHAAKQTNAEYERKDDMKTRLFLAPLRIGVWAFLACVTLPTMAMDVLSVPKGALALTGDYCATTGSGWEMVGGYTWQYRINGNEAEISSGSSSAAISPNPTGAVTIPSTLGGCPVTSIGPYAFYNCSGLTAVTIPGLVTSIGNYSFYGCSGLANVTIPNSVTSIGVQAFYMCHSLTSLIIPERVTRVGAGTFWFCSSLMRLTFLGNAPVFGAAPALGDMIFGGVPSSCVVTVPQGSTGWGVEIPGTWQGMAIQYAPDDPVVSPSDADFTIEDGVLVAYTGAGGDVVIPAGVTSIGDYAFDGCDLTSVTIPDSVTSIGSSAFYNCSGLTDVTIPDSVTSIGGNAFSYCYRLRDVTFEGDRAAIDMIVWRVFSGTPWLRSQPFGWCSYEENGDVWLYGYYGSPVPTETLVLPDDITMLTAWSLPRFETEWDGEGYRIFLGWFTAKEGGERVDDRTISIDGETTLYAHWEPVTPEWCYEIEDGQATITGNEVSLVGEVEIPATITDGGTDYPVTAIGEYAFEDMSGITSITIPDSVTSIGDSAFWGCSGLADEDGFVIVRDVLYSYHGEDDEVTIPDSVTSISPNAFNCWDLTGVTIPATVTSIGSWAFEACYGLAFVTFFGNAPILGDGVFYGVPETCVVTVQPGTTGWGVEIPGTWQGMTIQYAPDDSEDFTIEDGVLVSYNGAGGDVIIPDGVTSIGNSAFEYCGGLTSVTIPGSVTSIGKYAFSQCDDLIDATILGGVTSIGEWAFLLCTNMTSVTIPDSVTSIGDGAFYGCPGLADADGFVVIRNVLYYYCGGGGEITIPDGVTCIGAGAFYGCTGLTSVTIPNSVTNIGDQAFSGCTGLTNIIIPDSVTCIGKESFHDCTGLTSVTIPTSVTNIGYSAFSGCTDLTSMTIPNSVTSIGDFAFSGCTGLTSVTILNSGTSIGEGAFYGCTGLADEDGFVIVRNVIYYYCGEDDEITIPAGVTRIGYVAFYECSGLTSVTIPDSVTSIGDEAFLGCEDLTNVMIGSGVTSIGSASFAECGGLAHVTIPDNVTSIGEYAFAYCTSLTDVTIPDSVVSIGGWAFEASYCLAFVTFFGNAPILGDGVFDGVPSTCVVTVPQGSTGWGVDIPGTWQGLTIAYYEPPSQAVSVGEKGTVTQNEDGVYVVTATGTEMLTEDDFTFAVAKKAYKIDIAPDGLTATVTLKPPFEVEKSAGVPGEPWTEDGDQVTLNVEIVPGLYYAADSAATLGGLACPGASAPATAGTKLVVDKPVGGNAGFYQVWVSDKAIKAE